MNEAGVGDIVLFRGNTTNASGLRLVMGNSYYDHVGILMRDLDEKLFLIESTGTWGVSAIALDHFIDNDW